MTTSALLPIIETHRIFAVIRADSPDDAVFAAKALYDGGIRLLEIACTTPNAPAAIAKLTDLQLPNAVIGAGSVFNEQTAKNVIAAGASFVVSPVTIESVIAASLERDVLVMPGAATPNEIRAALESGADLVKIFPAHQLGGPAFIRALREPWPALKLCPTGGINEENLVDYLRAGAVAVGVGGKLADRRAIAEHSAAALTRVAQRYIQLLREFRL